MNSQRVQVTRAIGSVAIPRRGNRNAKKQKKKMKQDNTAKQTISNQDSKILAPFGLQSLPCELAPYLEKINVESKTHTSYSVNSKTNQRKSQNSMVTYTY